MYNPFMNAETFENQYNGIVIGGGPGGLAAAAMLAKAGKKVLLVEKESRLGGLTAPVVHGRYTFDVGARLLMSCSADGPFGPGAIYSFLKTLGIHEQVEFIPIQPFDKIHFPEIRVQMWSGREQFIDGLQQAIPNGLDELPALLDLCERLYHASRHFARPGQPWTSRRALFEMPDFIRYATTTAQTVLARYIPDRRARTVVGALWPYLGIPPNEASFSAWANLMSAYIDEGAYFVRGGVHQLMEAIGNAFTRSGGEIRLESDVKRVLVKNRKVTGIELADGQRCFAPAVVANIDPRLVFGAMMDSVESPSGYRRRLGRLIPSDKGISISFVTDLNLPAMGFDFENLIYDGWDEKQVERHALNGQAGVLSLNITSAADPELAPPGQHLMSIFTGLPVDAPMRSNDVQQYGETVMSIVLKRIPELEGRLLLSDQGSAAKGYIAHAFDSIYGWKTTPWQSSLGRPPLHTPVKGLILAGQWTRPIQGVMAAILSGCEAARMILDAS
jgi:prolycopene isomerase